MSAREQLSSPQVGRTLLIQQPVPKLMAAVERMSPAVPSLPLLELEGRLSAEEAEGRPSAEEAQEQQ